MAPVQTARGRFAAGMVRKDTLFGAILLYSPGRSEKIRASSTSQRPSYSRQSNSTTRVSESSRCRCSSVRLATVPINSARAELIGTVANRTLLHLHLDDSDTRVAELLWREYDGRWLVDDITSY